MPVPISAVDSVSPAFADTKRLLFAPWKFGMWWRMSILGLLTGEFAGGGWSGGSTNFQFPQQHRQWVHWLVPPHSGMPVWVRDNWMWFSLCGLLLIALFFIAEYLASVSRFVLFDAVVTGRCEFRNGWRRRRNQGIRYFLWDIGFAFACIVALLLLIGVPLWSFIKKLPSGANPDWGALLAGGLLIFIGLIVFLAVAAVIDLFARDFLVPVMAMENCGVWAGWRRLRQLLCGEKLACAGYILIKIVLSVGSTILFGIMDLIVVIFLLIPMGIIGVAIYLAVRNMNLVWNFGTIAALIVAIALVIALMLWAWAFVYSPGLVFFQSYTLRFFASRYPTLDAAMNPPLPPLAPAVPPGLPPEPQFPFSPPA